MPQLCLNASFLALRDLMSNNTFPSPDAASSVSNLPMEPAPAGLLKMSALCVQAHTNRMIVRTKNLPNAQTATVHILPPAGNAQHSSLRKELSREQAGQTTSADMAVNSYAQVLANSQADLVNRNLALSEGTVVGGLLA